METNYWKGIYKILNEATMYLACKKNEYAQYSYRITFRFKEKEFEIEEPYSSFDMRTQKKDFIACTVFNTVKNWGTGKNWSEGKMHPLQKEAFELYMLCLTDNKKIQHEKEVEISELEKNRDSIEKKIQQTQLQILKLNPELYKEFSENSLKAINLIKEAVKLMNVFRHFGNNITHKGCEVQVGYEWIDGILRRRSELGINRG